MRVGSELFGERGCCQYIGAGVRPLIIYGKHKKYRILWKRLKDSSSSLSETRGNIEWNIIS